MHRTAIITLMTLLVLLGPAIDAFGATDKERGNVKFAHAEKAYSEGRLDEALKLYEEAAKLDPSTNNLKQLVALSMQLHLETKARKHIDEMDPKTAEALFWNGVLAMNNRKFDLAISCLDSSVKIQPTSSSPYVFLCKCFAARHGAPSVVPEITSRYIKDAEPAQRLAALSGLGSYFSELGKYDDASIYYKDALAIDRNNYYAILDMARCQIGQEEFAAALENFKRCRAIDPKDSGVLMLMSNLSSRLNKHEEALKYIDLALQYGPAGNVESIQLRRAQILDSQKKPLEAYKSLQNAAKLYPSCEILLACGTKALSIRKRDEAIKFLDQATRKATLAGHYAACGQLFIDLGQTNRAVPLHTKAISLATEAGPHYENRARTYVLLENFSNAESDARTALKIDPKLINAHNYLALACEKLGKENESINHLEIFAKLQKIPSFFVRAAERRLAQKRFQEALSDYDKAIKLLPVSGSIEAATVHMMKGDLCKKLGQLENAVDEYTLAIKHFPDECHPWYMRSQFQRERGFKVDAMLGVTEAIKLNPCGLYYNARADMLSTEKKERLAIADRTLAMKESWFKNAITYAQRAADYASLNQIDKAIADCDSSLAIQPLESTYFMRAKLLKQAKKYKAACADLDSALKLTPTNLKTRFERADLYQRIGDYPRALSDYNYCIAKDPKESHYRARSELYKLMGKTDEAQKDLQKGQEKWKFIVE